MTKFKGIIAVLAVLALTITCVPIFQSSAQAGEQDVRIVRLIKNPKTGATATQLKYLIDPENLLINKGTIVVFANSGVDQIGVSFEEGKACQTATKSGEGFKMDKKSHCYTTVVMPMGGTRSLRFMETGVYEYRVVWGSQIEEGRGKIIVY